MAFTIAVLLVGLLLMTMALSSSLLQRLPLSISMLYLGAGWLVGPSAFALLSPDPIAQAPLLERVTEVALVISLFSTGLKLGARLGHSRWLLPLRLAIGSMMLTEVLITAVGTVGLGLPLGGAILLAAILSPTDPVLASEVQVEDPSDRDHLRFSLTGEAGLNDGAAFPVAMLGLGLLGLHDLGPYGIRWAAGDVLWAFAGGLTIGGGLGYLLGRLVVLLRTRHQEAVGLDEFLALGLIALSYACATLCHACAFLAVFASGLALRRVAENLVNPGSMPEPSATAVTPTLDESAATHPDYAPAYMASAVLSFNDQMERIAEVATVVIVGAMLSYLIILPSVYWFLPLLFLIIRPVSVLLGLARSRTTRHQRGLIAWFGIRGIGSIYYLMYAINHGVSRAIAQQLVTFTVITVATSIVIHGISVTPLMKLYIRSNPSR